MKKLGICLILICLCGCLSACTKSEESALKPVEPEQLLKSIEDKCDCRKCPDIDPYLENHNEFLGSDSQMLYFSDKALESLYKRYDELCTKIINNFKEDKGFVTAFKKDIAAFKKYRETQSNMIYPRQGTTLTYGTMYEYTLWGYNYSLTVQQIENTKRNVEMYCDSNSAFLKDDSVCSEDRINEMFESVKLKTPKPVISTPYDKK